jgi:hypothetical protein
MLNSNNPTPICHQIWRVILCNDCTIARAGSDKIRSRMNGEQSQTLVGEACFINQKQLLARLPISRRTLFNWRTTGKIPCVRPGGRRILFHWPSVEAALLRHQNPAA